MPATKLTGQSAPVARAMAHAEEFALAKVIVLDSGVVNPRPVLSRDERFLAFVHHPQNDFGPSSVVIVALPSGSRARTITFTQTISGIAWSPDGTRLFAIDYNSLGFMIEVGSGKITHLGKVAAARFPNADEIIWAEPTGIYFFPTDYIEVSQRYDLDALTASRVGRAEQAVALRAQLRRSSLDHPFVALVAEGPGCPVCNFYGTLGAANRDQSFVRAFFAESFRGAALAPSAAYAAVEDGDRRVRLLITGTRPRPRLGLEANLVSLPAPLDRTESDSMHAILVRGDTIFAEIFRPRVNPLNQRLIGGDGPSKGIARILRFGNDGKIEARIVREYPGTASAGDVLMNFWTRTRGTLSHSVAFRSAGAAINAMTER